MINFPIIQEMGGGLWVTLHLTAHNAKTNTENIAVLFIIKVFTKKLPCRACRDKFYQYVKDHPPKESLKKHGNLFYWTYKAHDYVNKSTGKERISFDDIEKIYSNLD